MLVMGVVVVRTVPWSPTVEEPMIRGSSEEIQVISDEELSKRYRRGVEEGRMTR